MSKFHYLKRTIILGLITGILYYLALTPSGDLYVHNAGIVEWSFLLFIIPIIVGATADWINFKQKMLIAKNFSNFFKIGGIGYVVGLVISFFGNTPDTSTLLLPLISFLILGLIIGGIVDIIKKSKSK